MIPGSDNLMLYVLKEEFSVCKVEDYSRVDVGRPAGAGIGIFAVSTFNTDYIITRAEDLEKALQVLLQAGYTIKQPE